MKQTNILIFAILISITLLKCDKKEMTERNYPRLHTLNVTNITSKGAKFNAEFRLRGDFEIKNYGFIWSNNQNPSLNNADKIIYSDNIQNDSFSAIIQSTLAEDIVYYVRSFAETADYIVYGETVNFISLGSQAPVIYSFKPTKGIWGDTITIIGKNFSYLLNKNIGYLGSIKLLPIAATDTVLKYIIPSLENQEVVPLSIEILGNKSSANDLFSYTKPEIFSINTNNAAYGDTITIKGENFFKDYLEVSFNSKPAEIIEVDKNSIRAILPYELQDSEAAIIVKSFGFSDTIQGITLLLPEITKIEPSVITKSDEIVKIVGNNFNLLKNANQIIIEHQNGIYKTATSEIISISKNEILFQIDPSKLFTCLSVTYFSQLNSKVKTYDFESNEINSELEYKSTWTKLDDFPGKARYGAVAFSINGKGYFGTGISNSGFLSDFWEFDPITEQWIQIDDCPGKQRGSAISFVLNNEGYVGLGTDTFIDGEMGHNDIYKLNPTTKNWINVEDFPSYGRYSSTSFSLNNEGYVVGGYWGDSPNTNLQTTNEVWKYDPISNTWQQLNNFPYSKTGDASASLNNDIYIYSYNSLYKHTDNGWVSLPSPDLGAWDMIAFSINENLYFGLGCPHSVHGSHILYEYNPENQSYINKDIYYTYKRYAASVFVINNKAYIIGGVSYDSPNSKMKYYNDVWEFDPSKPELLPIQPIRVNLFP